MRGPEIDTSALIIVDMQNDFVHPEGGFAHRAREASEKGIDMPFLMGTIPAVQRFADAFRTAGRPVVSLAHMVKPDYSDAQFPYGRLGLQPGAARPFIVEGTWGAQIIDALQPRGRAPGHQERLRGIREHAARHDPEAELQTMARLFADVHTTDEVVAMLASATTARG
jgi:ureidoacrylate peracid hydrolase